MKYFRDKIWLEVRGPDVYKRRRQGCAGGAERKRRRNDMGMSNCGRAQTMLSTHGLRAELIQVCINKNQPFVKNKKKSGDPVTGERVTNCC